MRTGVGSTYVCFTVHPLSIWRDALLELVGVLVAQPRSGGVDFDLFVESDVGVVVGVIGAVDNDFRAFALAQRVFDGELA